MKHKQRDASATTGTIPGTIIPGTIPLRAMRPALFNPASTIFYNDTPWIAEVPVRPLAAPIPAGIGGSTAGTWVPVMVPGWSKVRVPVGVNPANAQVTRFSRPNGCDPAEVYWWEGGKWRSGFADEREHGPDASVPISSPGYLTATVAWVPWVGGKPDHQAVDVLPWAFRLHVDYPAGWFNDFCQWLKDLPVLPGKGSNDHAGEEVGDWGTYDDRLGNCILCAKDEAAEHGGDVMWMKPGLFNAHWPFTWVGGGL